MLYWWPGWLICLEHEAIDVDDKVVGHSEFPTFFLACWLVDWLHVTLNRKLGCFRYALIIIPLTSSFLRLHISYTRVNIGAPLGRGFAASRSVAIRFQKVFVMPKIYVLGLCDHIQFKIVTIMHVCIVAQVLLISSIWHCLHFISHVKI